MPAIAKKEVIERLLALPGETVTATEIFKLFSIVPKVEKKKVTNDAIKDWLTNIGATAKNPASVERIIGALELEYGYEAISEICARLRGMEKRPTSLVKSKVINGTKHWYRT